MAKAADPEVTPPADPAGGDQPSGPDRSADVAREVQHRLSQQGIYLAEPLTGDDDATFVVDSGGGHYEIAVRRVR
jgi:hypothetical protein